MATSEKPLLAVLAAWILVWLLRENLDLSTAPPAHVDSKPNRNIDSDAIGEVTGVHKSEIKTVQPIIIIAKPNVVDVTNATTSAAAPAPPPTKKESAIGTSSDLWKQIIDDQDAEIQALRAKVNSLEKEKKQILREPEEISKPSLSPTPLLRVANADVDANTAREDDNEDQQPILASARIQDLDPNYNSNTAASQTSLPSNTSSCGLLPPLDPSDFASDLEFYKAVHKSPAPACAAGSWIYRPEERMVISEAHLQCLDRERQGNCHDPDAWKHTNDTAKKSRHNSILKNAVRNSPGILNASDPWVWESDAELYRVMDHRNRDSYRSRVRKLFDPPVTIFFVGDSLTRQWQHAMKCELEHVIGIANTEERVRYKKLHVGFEENLIRGNGNIFREATDKDYVIFNFGHHTGNKLGKGWPSQYVKILEKAWKIDFGNIPDRNIFFRTTTVRHFLAHKGDWNTEHSEAGGIAPDATAQWSWYGGNSPEQPKQNMLALDVILGNHTDRPFRVLDTAPMTLPRADSSFDGSHLCLPGPMEFWSRMLYHRMERDQQEP